VEIALLEESSVIETIAIPRRLVVVVDALFPGTGDHSAGER
jgi:hypothetical protein